MTKNVLIFSTVYLPMIGGAELAVKEITDRLPECNFSLITSRMSRRYPKTEKIGNIEVYRVGFGCSCDKFLLPILGFLKAHSLLKIHKPILIWSIMASYGGIAALFFKKKYSKIPFLLTLQEGDYHPEKKLGFAGLFFKKIVKKADYIQTISDYLKEEAIKAGARPEIVEVAPNGADLEKIRNSKSEMRNKAIKLKSELNIKEGEKIIITVSRLVEKNAVDVIIDSFNILTWKLSFQNLKLLIIGDGYLRNNLELKAKSRKLQAQVVFLGNLPQEKVYQYLLISDVFVRPSRSEGLGSAFIEAMACGVPVIGTRVGGIPDFLEDRKTGLFCEIDNPENLAVKIKELLENENLRREIIANSLKLVEEKYSWDKISIQMKNIFEKLT